MNRIQHINPTDTYETLRSRNYTNVVTVESPGKLIFVSGQLPLDVSGGVVGKDDIAVQTRVVFQNIMRVLRAAGGSPGSVVKLTSYVTDIVMHPLEVRKVRAEFFGVETPPASVMIEVRRFAHPDILIEIDAIASVPN